MGEPVEIAVLTTFTRPEWGKDYGHRTRYLWPAAVPDAVSSLRVKARDTLGRITVAEHYYRMDECSEVAKVEYVVVEGGAEPAPLPPLEDFDDRW